MATATGTVIPGVQRPPFTDRLGAWVKAHRQLSTWIGGIVVVGAGLFIWNLLTERRSEEIASRDLQGARFAFENQNLPLAASELAKVIANYSGTNASDEARLLLANVRLLQGQPQQAVAVMKDYAPVPAVRTGRRPTGFWLVLSKTWGASARPERHTKTPLPRRVSTS